MVPEYLTPSNGGLLAPGQLMTVMRAAFVRFSGAGVWELVLEVSRDVRVGKVGFRVLRQRLGSVYGVVLAFSASSCVITAVLPAWLCSLCQHLLRGHASVFYFALVGCRCSERKLPKGIMFLSADA